VGSGRRYAAVFAAAYVVALVLLWLNGPAKALRVRDYISDEVWYVSAAVNVARDILGLHIVPRTGNGTVVYTVFYDAANCSLEEAKGLVLEEVPGARLLNRSYEKIHAFAVEAPASEAPLLEALAGERGGCIVDVMPGVAPDSENINTYLNTEHPPLVKYILVAVLAARGWDPAAWRLASFAAAAVGLAAAVYAAYIAFSLQERRSLPVALLAAAVFPAAAARDPSLSSMAAVGMLDIYAASLDAVALALLVSGRRRAAATALGLAGASKYTGLFPLPVLAVAVRLETGSTRRALAVGVLLPLAVTAAMWLPFVAARGPGWVVEQLAGALAWHTTSRPPGPPSTTPLGLILGRDGFVLHYTREGRPLLAAVCNPGVCATGVVVGALAAAAALASRCLRRWRMRHLVLLANGGFPFTAWLGYAAVYAAGNHTLYSFYSVQISMLSLPALATIPLLVEELDSLRPRPLCGCLLTRWAPLSAAASSAAGVAVSAFAAGGWPPPPPQPLLEPLAAGLDPGSKLARLGLFASTLLVYAATAARLTPRATRAAEGARHAASWLLAGLLSYTAPSATLAPIVLLAARHPGLPESILAGLAGPGPAGLLAASHQPPGRRMVYAAGYTAGYMAALAVLAWSTPGPHWAPLGTVALLAATAAAVAAAYSSPLRGEPLSYSLAALLAPSLAPLLALTPTTLPAAALAPLLHAWLGLEGLRLAAAAALATVLAGLAASPRRPRGG